MHPQLTELDAELEAASTRLGALVANTSEEAWTRRPPSGGWSPAECVAHLNLTTRATIPHLEKGIAEARKRGGGIAKRLRRDVLGWLLWKSMQPTQRMKVPTGPDFVPTGDLDRTRLINEFDELQADLQRLLEESDGLPVSRVKVVSAFNERLRYSIFSCFAILATHEHRHLLQAERAATASRSSPSDASAA